MIFSGMNNTLKFAIYIVVFSLIWLVGEKLLGYQNTIVDWLPFTSLLWLILIGVFYIVFLRSTRQQATKVVYKTNVKSLVTLSIYWLLAFGLVKWVYFLFVNPDYFNDLIIRGREWLTLTATSEENFENATRMMDDFLQLPVYLGITTTVQLIFCLIYAFLFPAFVKNK
ncbi:DUF4199 family protein [Runella aurantiaca]|uniref:DUF4199 family protein n=1 Tax=Runella aurantiaca TaxID=2282308 RepID=A0A369IM77_9BACT|nr:DUF4199 family protein [Runella aurantiaca]RDB07746.1 DUF4199 family protein [Runella aurantiaca]